MSTDQPEDFSLAEFIAYVDEFGHSKDPNRRFAGLGGLIAKKECWKGFEPAWKDACARAGLSEPFHMMDFSASKKQFTGWNETQRRSLLQDLFGIIQKAEIVPIGSVVSVAAFNSLNEEWKKKHRDPYFVAFQPLTYNLAACASLAFPPGPVTMIYARHPEYSTGKANSQDLWYAFRAAHPYVALFMKAYESAEPQNCLPLQAADLWSYELGHHFEVIRPAGLTPRFPFRRFVEMGLNYSFAHNFITLTDEHGQFGIGKMAQVQQWREINLYEPGFTNLRRVASARSA